MLTISVRAAIASESTSYSVMCITSQREAEPRLPLANIIAQTFEYWKYA